MQDVDPPAGNTPADLRRRPRRPHGIDPCADPGQRTVRSREWVPDLHLVPGIGKQARFILDDPVLARRRTREIPGMSDQDPHGIAYRRATTGPALGRMRSISERWGSVIANTTISR